MIAFIREIRAMNKRAPEDTTTPRVRSQPLSDLDAARTWLADRDDCTGQGRRAVRPQAGFEETR
jgi:hypothetical protein